MRNDQHNHPNLAFLQQFQFALTNEEERQRGPHEHHYDHQQQQQQQQQEQQQQQNVHYPESYDDNEAVDLDQDVSGGDDDDDEEEDDDDDDEDNNNNNDSAQEESRQQSQQQQQRGKSARPSHYVLPMNPDVAAAAAAEGAVHAVVENEAKEGEQVESTTKPKKKKKRNRGKQGTPHPLVRMCGCSESRGECRELRKLFDTLGDTEIRNGRPFEMDLSSNVPDAARLRSGILKSLGLSQEDFDKLETHQKKRFLVARIHYDPRQLQLFGVHRKKRSIPLAKSEYELYTDIPIDPETQRFQKGARVFYYHLPNYPLAQVREDWEELQRELEAQEQKKAREKEEFEKLTFEVYQEEKQKYLTENETLRDEVAKLREQLDDKTVSLAEFRVQTEVERRQKELLESQLKAERNNRLVLEKSLADVQSNLHALKAMVQPWTSYGASKPYAATEPYAASKPYGNIVNGNSHSQEGNTSRRKRQRTMDSP